MFVLWTEFGVSVWVLRVLSIVLILNVRRILTVVILVEITLISLFTEVIFDMYLDLHLGIYSLFSCPTWWHKDCVLSCVFVISPFILNFILSLFSFVSLAVIVNFIFFKKLMSFYLIFI